MSTLISNLSLDSMKVRWKEPYTSEALNIALASRRPGVYYGFEIVPGGLLTVDLAVSTVYGSSMLVYRDTSNAYGISVWRDSSDNLDLTAFASTKVYLGVTVSYVQGVATAGTITAYSQAEYDAGLGDVVILGAVNVPGGGSIAQSHIDLTEAWVPYQFLDNTVDPSDAGNDIRVGFPVDKAMEITIVQTNDADYDIDSNSTGISINSYRMFKNGATAGNLKVAVADVVMIRNDSLVTLSFEIETAALSCDEAGVIIDYYGQNHGYIGSEILGLGVLVVDSTAWQKLTASYKAQNGARYAVVSIYSENIDNGEVYITRIRMICEEQTLPRLGRRTYADISKSLVHGIVDVTALDEGVTTKWNPVVPDWLQTRLAGKGSATWAIGITGAQININLDGSMKADFYEFNSLKTWTVQWAFESSIRLYSGSGVVATASPGSVTLDVITLSSGGGDALIPMPQIPSGATIRDIRIGVQNNGDASLTFDMDIVRIGKFTANPVNLASVAGLVRTGGSTIRQVEWANANYTPLYAPGGVSGVFALRIKNQGASPHDVYWVEVEYEAERIEYALGMVQ